MFLITSVYLVVVIYIVADDTVDVVVKPDAGSFPILVFNIRIVEDNLELASDRTRRRVLSCPWFF